MQVFVEESLASAGRQFEVAWNVAGGWDALPERAVLAVTISNEVLFQEFTKAEIESFPASRDASEAGRRLSALARQAIDISQ
jgi:hypothetical protein